MFQFSFRMKKFLLQVLDTVETVADFEDPIGQPVDVVRAQLSSAFIMID